MHKNQIWFGFLIVITLIVLWFTGITFWKIYRYNSLNRQTPAITIDWSPIKLSEERYSIKARYTYDIEGKKYSGASRLKNHIYRNAWGAEEALPELKNQKWLIWYAPSNPSYSAITKIYPLKETIYLGILWILLIYFIWLGMYVGQKRR